MKYQLLVVFLFMAFNSFAQERAFFGKVIDKDTKEGIPFSVVKAKDRNEGIYTDENGRFAFTSNTDSAKSFIFYCLGYARQELQANQLSSDSIVVELRKQYSNLGEVVIKDRTGKMRSTYMGKKKSKHVGDCYQKYGEEDALFLKADKSRDGVLKEVWIYITDEGVPDSKFRIHIYAKDSVTNLPSKELTDSNLIVHATHGDEWVKTDLSNKWIPVNDGVFISVEWISGHGNENKSLQSVKHAEVNNHNGQVLGLTRNMWKGKGHIEYMYHRDAFHNEWGFSFNPLLCPMIYAKYTYYKN